MYEADDNTRKFTTKH